jgi:hypothetical protein
MPRAPGQETLISHLPNARVVTGIETTLCDLWGMSYPPDAYNIQGRFEI